MKGAFLMKKIVILPLIAFAIVAVATVFIYPNISANAGEYDTFSGDKKTACEALLCLTSGKRPDECEPPIRKYLSIKHKKWKDTRKARKNFLKLCPDGDDSGGQGSLVDAIVDSQGRCEAKDLNRNVITLRWEQEEEIRGIDDRMPKYCTDYHNHTYTVETELPRYIGTPENDGYWVEAVDYDAELQKYEERQEQKRIEEERRRAEQEWSS
jgi:hypothetical protein